MSSYIHSGTNTPNKAEGDGTPSDKQKASEAQTNANDKIEAASQKAFSSTAMYLQSELESAGGELHLLEKLNDASIAKYEGISRQAQDMLVHASKTKQIYKEMETQMAEIDNLVQSIDSLEQMALELDGYSQQLEAKFQSLLR
ncbi:biogenesis of lysosome- organelles complex 1 subunit 2 [Dipsacomyces acuminosporus]|nr:biogenesis of lysosome- organelles complex 1 subunit 2 [Dipsacomyces acuminosporus]